MTYRLPAGASDASPPDKGFVQPHQLHRSLPLSRLFFAKVSSVAITAPSSPSIVLSVSGEKHRYVHSPPNDFTASPSRRR